MTRTTTGTNRSAFLSDVKPETTHDPVRSEPLAVILRRLRWTQVMTDTLTTTPWALEFYTGYNPPTAGDTQSQSVSFSNLVITSASTP
jgi:hypothetical protein